MKKNLLIPIVAFTFLSVLILQVKAQQPTQIVFAGFDITPFSPLELSVLEDQGYSINDDYVVEEMLSLTDITIPIENTTADGISVQYWPTELGQLKFYNLSFTASADADRTATLFVGMGVEPGIAYLDTTFTITAESDTYSFEFQMTEPSDTAGIVSLGLGNSDISVYLDDFVFTEIIRITSECIEVEAESFADQPNFEPFYVVDTLNQYTETACGGMYINSDSTQNSTPVASNIDYEFTVEGGTYQVWFRGLGLGGSSDSFWVRMDDGEWISFNNALRDTEWVWDKVHDSNRGGQPVSFSLSPGTHTFSIAFRESGTMLDKFLITTDTLGIPEGCNGCEGLGGSYMDTLFVADGSLDPVAPMELVIMDGYDVDDTYEYVRDGQLVISGITLPGNPENEGIQVNYGPFSTQANRLYKISFDGNADVPRQARIYVGTKSNPDTVFLDVPFIMLNMPIEYEFEFEVDDIVAQNLVFSIQLGSSDAPVTIDNISIVETFPEVDEECFAFEPDEFSDQELFAPFFVAEDTEACNGFYIDSEVGQNQSQPEETGRVTYEFEVQQRATFAVWLRAIAPSATDDSFWVIMNGEAVAFNGITLGTTWIWDRVRGSGRNPYLFDLLPGTNTLEIVLRESRTKLDKVFITNQLHVVPEGCDVCGTTSVDAILEMHSNNELLIYPNPASGLIKIEPKDGVNGILNVYNILGKKILSKNIERNTTLSTDDMQKGIYLFEFNTTRGRSVQKIVVQ